VSVRDTGWVKGRRTISFRDSGATIFLTAWPEGEWTLTIEAESQGAGVPDAAVQQRAAEDALRTLCRDTLKALGDGE